MSVLSQFHRYDSVTHTGFTGSAKIPTGTTAERDVSPANGYLRFNTSTGLFEGYIVDGWKPVGGEAQFVTFNPATTWLTSTNVQGAMEELANADPTQISSLGVGTPASGVTGEIRATGDITAHFSDDNLKTRIEDIVDAVAKVCTLDAFIYEPNEVAQALGYAVKRDAGISAQQVQKILPEAVVTAPIDDKYLTVRYEKIIPLLVAAIKELQAEIETLKGR